MSNQHSAALSRLGEVLSGLGRMAVAVSGGVDSMTLSLVAHRTLGSAVEMFHAVSPAVPPDATERVQRYTGEEGWRLHLVNTGEFDDVDYLRNPVHRCFHCKKNLYAELSTLTDAVLVSGTNLDDLGDYRPGLAAAAEHCVRHPYVEAGIGKATVRELAGGLGFPELAVLPSAPCLSSRIETGIRIDPRALKLVDQVEKLIVRETESTTVRCRVRKAGIVVELDKESLSELSHRHRARLSQLISDLCGLAGIVSPISFSEYRMGSAFLGQSESG